MPLKQRISIHEQYGRYWVEYNEYKGEWEVVSYNTPLGSRIVHDSTAGLGYAVVLAKVFHRLDEISERLGGDVPAVYPGGESVKDHLEWPTLLPRPHAEIASQCRLCWYLLGAVALGGIVYTISQLVS